jgi:ATP-dependent RNA helicase DHX36
VRDCTPVSAFALMLFGGALKAAGTALRGEGDRLLSVDGWMKFKVKPAEVSLMIQVREELDALLRQKIAKPSLELTRQGQGVLAAVRMLLAKSAAEQ